MDALAKLIQYLKIPLKILLPALWLFSCLMMFLNEKWLTLLHLTDFKMKNSSTFGLFFIITSCFIAIYIASYLIKFIVWIYNKITQNWRTLQNIMRMNEAQKCVVIGLYLSPYCTAVLDYSEPVVQSLLALQYIYAGSTQMISASLGDGNMPMKFTLQPFVYNALEWSVEKLKSRQLKLKNKLSKARNNIKKDKIKEELNEITEMLNNIQNGGKLK